MRLLNPITYYRLARWLYLHKVPFVPRVIDRMTELVFHCRLPFTAEIGEGFEVGHYGLGVFLHPRTRIGRNVMLGPTVHIGGRSNQWEVPRIGNDVYVATGAKILGDLEIGDGCVIGANAVVISSIPARCAAAGVPAKIIKRDIDVYDCTGWPKYRAPQAPQPTVPPAEVRPPKQAREQEVTRVFYLVDSLAYGGSESQLFEVARRLNGGPYRLTVGTLSSGGVYAEQLRQLGIPVVEFPLKGSLLRPGAFLQLMRMARFLHRGAFDVVHTHTLWSNLMGVPAAWLSRVPVIVSSRRDLAHWWWYTPFRRKALRHVQNRSTYVLANSNAIRDFLVREDGFRAEKIRVVRNAVDFERFSTARGQREQLVPGLLPEHKVVAFVANMNLPVKGHLYLIHAAKTVCAAVPATRFLLIGDGRQRPHLMQEATALGVAQNILFLGQRKDVPELLACCDLSVLPSTAEGLPNAILESMAAGLPVVATAVGGSIELVEDGVTGVLVPPKEPGALADALLRILRDPDLSRRMGRAGQERACTHFSFERVLLELNELYQEPLLKKTAKLEQQRRRDE